MSSRSSYITGGGIISVSVCRVVFLDLLHLFTASTMRRLIEIPRAKVSRNVRITARATETPKERLFSIATITNSVHYDNIIIL